MEYILGILFVAVVGYLLTQKRKSDDSLHPLDAATKPKASWPFPGGEVGEGKIHVKVADVVEKATEEVKTVEAKVEAVVEEVKAVETAVVEQVKKTATKVKAVAKKTPAKKKST